MRGIYREGCARLRGRVQARIELLVSCRWEMEGTQEAMNRIHVNQAVALRAVPILMIAGGVTADFRGPEPYGGLPFLVAAPLVAGLMSSWWISLVIAVAACVTSVVVNLRLYQGPAQLQADLLIILFVSFLGLWTKWLMDRQARSLKVTRDIAAAAQRAILPEPPTLRLPTIPSEQVKQHADTR